MARRPRCAVCGSRRWHRDALSGSVVCEEGHLLQGYVHETTDTQEGPSQHTQTTRRMRKNKRKKDRPPANAHFHGDRSRFLLFQCMQLILREQLRVIIDDLGWPVELEAVVRDLWQLLVASSHLQPTPVDAARHDEPSGSYSGPRPGQRYNRTGRRKYGPRGGVKRGPDAAGEEAENGHSAVNGLSGGGPDHQASSEMDGAHSSDGESHSDDAESSSSLASESGDQADDERPSPGSRSRANSPTSAPLSPAASSQTPLESNFNMFMPPRRTRRRAYRARVIDDPREAPRAEFTLLIIYLACVTLRLPVFLSDIFRLAETYQILYLDAAIHLPRDMQNHLDRATRDALSPRSVPHLYSHTPSLKRHSQDGVETWLQRLVVLYREDWGLHFPEANVPLLLGRVVEMLALPPVVYAFTRHLLSLLPGPVSFHLATDFHTRLPAFYLPSGRLTSPHQWPRPAGRLHGAQDWRAALPEIKLASLVVFVVRLLWRLDEDDGLSEDVNTESPARSNLPDSGLPPLEEWLTAAESLAALTLPGDFGALWSGPVCELQHDEIDAYLEWFEDRILSSEKIPSRFNDIARFFPAPEVYAPPRPQFGPQAYLSKVDQLLEPLYGPRLQQGANQGAKDGLPGGDASNMQNSVDKAGAVPQRAFADGFEPLFPPSSTPPPPPSSLQDAGTAMSIDACSSPVVDPAATAGPNSIAHPGQNPATNSDCRDVQSATTTDSAPSHLPSVLPTYARHAVLPTDGPLSFVSEKMHRLLTVVASRLTPCPLGAVVHPASTGVANTDSGRGATSLLPFVEQVEWALEHAFAGRSVAPGESEDEEEEPGGTLAHERPGQSDVEKRQDSDGAAAQARIDRRTARSRHEVAVGGRWPRRYTASARGRKGDPYIFAYAVRPSQGQDEDGMASPKGGIEDHGTVTETYYRQEGLEEDAGSSAGSVFSMGGARATPRPIVKSAEFVASSDEDEGEEQQVDEQPSDVDMTAI